MNQRIKKLKIFKRHVYDLKQKVKVNESLRKKKKKRKEKVYLFWERKDYKQAREDQEGVTMFIIIQIITLITNYF